MNDVVTNSSDEDNDETIRRQIRLLQAKLERKQSRPKCDSNSLLKDDLTVVSSEDEGLKGAHEKKKPKHSVINNDEHQQPHKTNPTLKTSTHLGPSEADIPSQLFTSSRHNSNFTKGSQLSRFTLGVDKGIKARDISLQKPASSFVTKLNDFRHDSSIRATKQQQLKRDRRKEFETSLPVENQEAQAEETLEPHTKLALSKVYMDSKTLDQKLVDATVFTLPKLMTKVFPPNFDPPDSCVDWVVMGIVCRKSEVKENHAKQKYMMFTLTDLNVELSVCLQGKAFIKYWKIREGDLIAILNPEIYVSKSAEAGNTQFNLSMSGPYNALLEVGRSRDLGFCSAITAKGHKCGRWINCKRMAYCDFHLEIGVNRTRSSRMEFSSTAGTKLMSPKKNGQRLYMSMGGHHNKGSSTEYSKELLRDPSKPTVDRLSGTGGRLFVSDSMSQAFCAKGKLRSSSEGFFEDDIYDGQLSNEIKEKRLLKRKRDMEREIHIREKLSAKPGGFLLRNFDCKGRLVDEETDINDMSLGDKPDITARLFTPHQIRKIGFDPTRRIHEERPKDSRVGKGDINSISLRKPKAKILVQHDDDDDLEIIM